MKECCFLVLLAALAASTLGATEVPAERFEVWPEGKMPACEAEQSTPYFLWHTPSNRTSRAVLIAVSGGGYKRCTVTGLEVDPVRDYFLAKGVTVVTFAYRVPRPIKSAFHLTAWQDAQRTVRLVRREAKRRGLDPENIGFTGCSAGGHLTMLVATSSQTPAYAPIDEVDAEACHVNWAVPVYPAFLLEDALDSNRPNLADSGKDLSVAMSPLLKFDAKTPPMCFFVGDADCWTMHSVRAYHRLRQMGIPGELHVLAKEPHFFMRKVVPDGNVERWKDIFWGWLVRMEINRS